jgi:hypothetical protein
LEDEIHARAESPEEPQPIHVREGDGLEGLVGEMNKLIEKVSKKTNL